MPAVEVLFATGALGQLVRDGKTQQVASLIQLGKSHGMVEMDEALIQLVRAKEVAPETAYLHAMDKKELRKRMRAEFGVTVGEAEDDDDLIQPAGS